MDHSVTYGTVSYAGAMPVTTDVKPRLRGWLHAGAFPVAVVAAANLARRGARRL